MGDGLFNLPDFHIPARDALALAGRVLAFLAWVVALVALTALRVVVVVFLRLLRPFILTGLFLAIVGGVGMATGFAYWHHWQDAMQAALVVFVCATVFMLYSCIAMKIDPQRFENTSPAWWCRY